MKSFLTAAVLAATATASHAATYDFIDAIDGAGGPINESIWTEFNTSDFAYFTGPSISLTGTAKGAAAYAYADAGTAGFGVCRTPVSKDGDASFYVDEAAPGPRNVCAPGSDDSIQSEFEEVLTITANENDTLIQSIRINANHDGKLSTGDKVKIGGVEITLGAGDIVGGYYTHVVDTLFAKGGTLTIESVNRPHLYLDTIELVSISTVPVPAAGFLLIGGLGALSVAARKRKG